MLDRFSKYVLDIEYCMTHILYHTLINCDMLSSIPCTTHHFHHLIQCISHFEKRIITKNTLWNLFLVIWKMYVPTHEFEWPDCHGVMDVGEIKPMWTSTPELTCASFFWTKVSTIDYENWYPKDYGSRCDVVLGFFLVGVMLASWCSFYTSMSRVVNEMWLYLWIPISIMSSLLKNPIIVAVVTCQLGNLGNKGKRNHGEENTCQRLCWLHSVLHYLCWMGRRTPFWTGIFIIWFQCLNNAIFLIGELHPWGMNSSCWIHLLLPLIFLCSCETISGQLYSGR